MHSQYMHRDTRLSLQLKACMDVFRDASWEWGSDGRPVNNVP